MFIQSKHWMVVGYDIYRDARQQRAVGAFVASTNANFSRFFSKACNHNFNEDISPFFRENTLEALKYKT